ncbi:hypothetical protein LB503_000594 [Fusarium chuoi]|nr:hypothetical protein LB503_000594 [Fusarium chuoi]
MNLIPVREDSCSWLYGRRSSWQSRLVHTVPRSSLQSCSIQKIPCFEPAWTIVSNRMGLGNRPDLLNGVDQG